MKPQSPVDFSNRGRQLLHQLWDIQIQTAESELVSLRSRLLILLCSLSLGVNLLYATAILTWRDYAELWITVITLLLLAIVFYTAWRHGWKRWASVLYLFSAILSLLLYLIVSKETQASITIWIPFVPILSMLLLDRRDAYRITLLGITAIVITVYWIEYTGQASHTETWERALPTLFSILLGTLATLGVMRIYLQLRDRLAIRARREREARATLLNILCHDISNPLTAIRFSTERAQRKSATCMESLGVIQEATDMIIEMVEAIRAMRALEDGKLAVQLQAVNIKKEAQKAIDTILPQFTKKQVQLITDWDDTPVFVLADRVALAQTVLGNLLSNALKFTPKGKSVTVQIKSLESETLLVVKDEGIGIPPKLQSSLFDPGRHTSRTGTEGEPGTGFGLPLAGKMIDHFGGRIVVKSSNEGEQTGSQFSVYLQTTKEASS